MQLDFKLYLAIKQISERTIRLMTKRRNWLKPLSHRLVHSFGDHGDEVNREKQRQPVVTNDGGKKLKTESMRRLHQCWGRWHLEGKGACEALRHYESEPCMPRSMLERDLLWGLQKGTNATGLLISLFAYHHVALHYLSQFLYLAFLSCVCISQLLLSYSRKRDATLSITLFFVSLQQLHHDTNSMRSNYLRKQLACGGGTDLKPVGERLLLCRSSGGMEGNRFECFFLEIFFYF
jgi:hypothetical protein